MTTNPCDDFLNQLDAWLAGDRSANAEAHVGGCANCRALSSDMARIEAAARDWAAEESDPPARVWAALRAQLEEEGVIRARRSGWKSWVGSWMPAVPRPVMAGAYLAALVAIAFGLSGPIRAHHNQELWMQTAQNTEAPLDAQLNSAEQATMLSFPKSNSVVNASLHQSMNIVDNNIALCEKSVREEPENELAREYLYDAYQQKADLLAEMSERGE